MQGADSDPDDGSLVSWAEEVVCSGSCPIVPTAAAILLRANQRQCPKGEHDWDEVLGGEVVDWFVDRAVVEEGVDGLEDFDLEEEAALEYTVDVDCP